MKISQAPEDRFFQPNFHHLEVGERFQFTLVVIGLPVNGIKKACVVFAFPAYIVLEKQLQVTLFGLGKGFYQLEKGRRRCFRHVI